MTNSPTAPEQPTRLYYALSALAFGAFVALVAVALGRREFWTDETVTLGHIVTLAHSKDAFHPRGYYALLYGWKLLFGDSDAALRAFSVPWALLGLLLIGAIGRRTLRPGAAVLAQWLFILSPFVILYFRMARFYSMVTAVALLVAYCAVLIAQEGRRRHWIALGLSALLALHTNYIVSALMAPLFIWLGAFAWRRGHWGRYAAALIPAGIQTSFHIAMLLGPMSSIHGIESSAGHASLLQIALRVLLPAFSLAVGETTDPWRVYITLPAALAAGTAFVLGLLARPERPGASLVRWAWVLAVGGVAVTLSTVAKGEPLSSAARSTLFAAPFAFMLIATGIERIRRPVLRALVIAILLVANGYGLVNYFTGRQFLNPGYAVPWREVARTIESRRQPTDRVLAYFDTTVERYANFHRFINGRPDYHADQLEPVDAWPRDGFRLWLIARDRGSAEARRLQEETVQRLTPRAAKVEIFRLMPYSDIDRKFRALFLRRPTAESYLMIYLFTPPDGLQPQDDTLDP